MSQTAVQPEEQAGKTVEQSLTLMEGSLSTVDAYDSVRKLISSTHVPRQHHVDSLA